MADLISLDQLLTDLGKCNLPTAQVARYNALRLGVEQAIRSWCKWEINSATVTDYYSGAGYFDLPLQRPFVQSVANVWVDPTGNFGQNPTGFAGNPLTAGTDYAYVPDGNNNSGAVSRSGRLERLLNANVMWFPSDLFYYRRAGGLSYNPGPYWPAGRGNIKVTYTYGFDTIPEDIKLAVVTGVSIVLNTSRYGYMLTSEGLGSHSIGLSKDVEFGTVRSLLSHYRDLAVGI